METELTKRVTRVTRTIGGLFALILLLGCGPESRVGKVSVWLAVDARDLGGLTSLDIEVDSIGVHRAGHPLETGWMTWQPEQHRIDLVTLSQGRTIEVGTGEVPAGRYDRVRIVVEAGQAQASSGQAVPLALWVEPIAIPFELGNKDQIEIIIELIALVQADGGYKLFTKSAVISSR